jgi:hypothetical protein
LKWEQKRSSRTGRNVALWFKNTASAATRSLHACQHDAHRCLWQAYNW